MKNSADILKNIPANGYEFSCRSGDVRLTNFEIVPYLYDNASYDLSGLLLINNFWRIGINISHKWERPITELLLEKIFLSQFVAKLAHLVDRDLQELKTRPYALRNDSQIDLFTARDKFSYKILLFRKFPKYKLVENLPNLEFYDFGNPKKLNTKLILGIGANAIIKSEDRQVVLPVSILRNALLHGLKFGTTDEPRFAIRVGNKHLIFRSSQSLSQIDIDLGYQLARKNKSGIFNFMNNFWKIK